MLRHIPEPLMKKSFQLNNHPPRSPTTLLVAFFYVFPFIAFSFSHLLLLVQPTFAVKTQEASYLRRINFKNQKVLCPQCCPKTPLFTLGVQSMTLKQEMWLVWATPQEGALP